MKRETGKQKQLVNQDSFGEHKKFDRGVQRCLFAPSPFPKVALFLTRLRKRAKKEGRRSNAAEAGRVRSRALDDKQNLVPLRKVSWL